MLPLSACRIRYCQCVQLCTMCAMPVNVISVCLSHVSVDATTVCMWHAAYLCVTNVHVCQCYRCVHVYRCYHCVHVCMLPMCTSVNATSVCMSVDVTSVCLSVCYQCAHVCQCYQCVDVYRYYQCVHVCMYVCGCYMFLSSVSDFNLKLLIRVCIHTYVFGKTTVLALY